MSYIDSAVSTCSAGTCCALRVLTISVGGLGSRPIGDHSRRTRRGRAPLFRRRESRVAADRVAPSPRPGAPSRRRRARRAPPMRRRQRSGRHPARRPRLRLPSRGWTLAFIEYSITGSAATHAATSICAISMSWPSPVRRRCSSAASSATACVHPDDRIGGSLQVARRAVGVAGGSRHARRLLEVECPADVIAPRSLQPEPGHAHQDHVGLQLHQRLVVQTELLDHPRREVLHDDVGVADEPADQVAASIGREIQRDVALVEVRALPHSAALVPIVALVRPTHPNSGARRVAGSIRPSRSSAPNAPR